MKILQLISDHRMNLKLSVTFLTYTFVGLLLKSQFYDKSHYRVVHHIERNLASFPEFIFKWQTTLIEEFYEEVVNEPSEIKSYLWQTILSLSKILNGVCDLWLSDQDQEWMKIISCNISSCDSLVQNMRAIISEDLMESNLVEIKSIHKEAFNSFSAFYLGIHFDRNEFRDTEFYTSFEDFQSYESDEMFKKPLDIDDINDNEMEKRLKKIYNDFLLVLERAYFHRIQVS